MIRQAGIHGVVKWCYIFLYTYLFLATQKLFGFPAVVADALLVFFILISTILDQWKLRFALDRSGVFCYKHFLLPIGLIFGYSLAAHFFHGLGSDYYKHTLTRCVRITAYYLVGCQGVRTFGEKTVDYLLIAAVLAYIPAMVKYFSAYGLINGLVMLVAAEIFHLSIQLEVHTLTYILGFITLFYLYRYRLEKTSGMRNRFLVSLFLTIAGVKRIVLLALAAAILLFVFLNRISRRIKYPVMRMIALGMVLVTFLYLYMIQSGLLEKLFAILKINASFRFNFWNFFQDKYTVNPAFAGYGISYAARTMEHGWRYIEDLSASTTIHNDVLVIYLGIGFWGSLLYWYNYFYGALRSAQKVSINAAVFYLVVAVYYFVTAMVSNEGFNPITMGTFFLVSYTVIQNEFGKERQR